MCASESECVRCVCASESECVRCDVCLHSGSIGRLQEDLSSDGVGKHYLLRLWLYNLHPLLTMAINNTEGEEGRWGEGEREGDRGGEG